MKKAPTHLRLAALAIVIAAATAACGGGKSKTQAKPAAAVSSTTLDPEAAIRAEVLAAFAEYRKFYVDAIAKPDPRDPALEAHLTGSALTAMQRDQVGFQSTYEGERLTDVTDRPTIISVDPSGTRAVVDECVAAIAHYFDIRTGQAMGAPPATAPTSEGFEFVFIKEAGAWKVSEKHSKPEACQ